MKAEVIIRIAGFDASNIDSRKQRVMDAFADAVAKSISRALGIPLGEINIVFKDNVSLLQGLDIQQGGQLIFVAQVDSAALPVELPELDEPTLLSDIKAVPDIVAMLAEGVDSLDAIYVVEPVGEVLHKGENCWPYCDPEGFCDWCGSGNACCQGSLDNPADPEECSRGIPSTNAKNHECVAVTPAPPAPLDGGDQASAVGDPHMTTNSGSHFDLP